MDFVDAIEQALGQKAIRNYLDMQKGDVPATWADATLLKKTDGLSAANKRARRRGAVCYMVPRLLRKITLAAQSCAIMQIRDGSGGQTGIRTLETVSRLHTFQACAFDHSATCPWRRFSPK